MTESYLQFSAEEVQEKYDFSQQKIEKLIDNKMRGKKDMNLTGKNFLKLLDFTPEEITYLIDLSAELKEKKKKGIRHDVLTGKNIALIFEKNSTRTRCSFEVAAFDLGMHTTFLDPSASQIGKKESIADTARVLGRMYDGIEYRGFDQTIVEELAKYAGVPVWNGLTNEFHPTQMIADMLTIKEHFGHLKGIKLREVLSYLFPIKRLPAEFESFFIMSSPTGN